MAVLHQYDYIFAIGMLFAFLDAWNIGANDVANSFATSVSSWSLTMKQAMLMATVMEFGGAVLVGSRVADTIRSKILSVSAFEQQPAILMLGMMHCIVGGVIGVGIAAIGADGVNWGWKGVSQVFVAWVIAPVIAGCFGIVIFSITKYGVLKRKDPLRAGLRMNPLYFGVTSGILTMVIVWKGALLSSWITGRAGCVLGVVVAIYAIFLLPFLYRRLVLEDWTLKSWEAIKGLLLWKRGPVPPKPEGQNVEVVQDYYRGHAKAIDLSRNVDAVPTESTEDVEKGNTKDGHDATIDPISSKHSREPVPVKSDAKPSLEYLEKTPWCTSRNLFAKAKYYFFRGV